MWRVASAGMLACAVLAGCANRPPSPPPPPLYEYTGEEQAAGRFEVSEVVAISDFFNQKGRAYVDGVNGVKVHSRLSSIGEPVLVPSGPSRLLVRYYDGTTVQCQIALSVDVVAGRRYQAVLQSDAGRKNIRMSIKAEDGQLVAPMQQAGKILGNPFNFAANMPASAGTALLPDGCR